jgi:hypothetical protein
MYLIPFYVVEPDLAFREMRVVHMFVEHDGLPVGNYGLLEFYCPDPDCDCRRVILNVVEEKHPKQFLASISYAFDPEDDMPGPFLDPMNLQSEYAAALLELVEQLVLSDPDYVARLERHYERVKEAAVDRRHPAHRKIQQTLKKDAHDFPMPAPWKELVGRNDPCPCGSGKKYKYCCMR